MSKAPQERIQGGRYVFAGVPNDDDGEKFFQSVRKYLHTNPECTREAVRRRWRGATSWAGSCPRDEADSFVIYIEERTS